MNFCNENLNPAAGSRRRWGVAFLTFGLASLTALAGSRGSSTNAVRLLGDRPLTFEANLGQHGDHVSFVARGAAYCLSLAPTELQVQLQKVMRRTDAAEVVRPGLPQRGAPVQQATLRIELLGANPNAVMIGSGEVVGRANYFIGSDPAKWRTSVPAYERVRVADVYPGIHLLHYGNQQHLEYDFEVTPQADPAAIALRFSGADKLQIAANGDLIVTIGAEEIRQPQPVIYQTIRGQRKAIAGAYELADARTVKFSLGDYDQSVSLIIDPIVSYSSYFNATGDDILWAVAVGPTGDLYLAGETMTTSGLATPGAFQTNLAGVLSQHGDVFVSRQRNTNSLTDVYVTYLGGIAYEAAFGLAVDSSGNAYVTGYTGSTNFPTRLALQTNIAGSVTPGFSTPPLDCFITKIGPEGTNLVFSTFFGGSADDVGQGIALDASGDVFVSGQTASTNLPTANTTHTNTAGLEDAFVLKLSTAGTNLIYAMYLGGANRDYARDIAVDGTGSPIIAGYTSSTNFPVTTNAFQLHLNQTTNISAADDAFVAKLSATSGTVTYATYLGGTNHDRAIRLATDGAGAVYLTGWTLSGNFPQTTTNFAAAVITNSSAADVFVTKLNVAHTNLDYSAVFGGTGKDEAWDIAVDAQGQAHVTGETASLNFPTNALTGILRGTNSGGTDAFLAALNSTGSAFVHSAYLGGTQTDRGYGVAVDAGGNSYFIGETIYSTFPTLPAVPDTGFTDLDGFIVKLVSQPALAIAVAGPNVEVSWPGFLAEFVLQANPNLLASNAWLMLTNPVVFTNSRHVVTLPASNAPAFFRLIK